VESIDTHHWLINLNININKFDKKTSALLTTNSFSRVVFIQIKMSDGFVW
jgi:hypothetical protein